MFVISKVHILKYIIGWVKIKCIKLRKLIYKEFLEFSTEPTIQPVYIARQPK